MLERNSLAANAHNNAARRVCTLVQAEGFGAQASSCAREPESGAQAGGWARLRTPPYALLRRQRRLRPSESRKRGRTTPNEAAAAAATALDAVAAARCVTQTAGACTAPKEAPPPPSRAHKVHDEAVRRRFIHASERTLNEKSFIRKRARRRIATFATQATAYTDVL